jgi:hypothetical protein
MALRLAVVVSLALGLGYAAGRSLHGGRERRRCRPSAMSEPPKRLVSLVITSANDPKLFGAARGRHRRLCRAINPPVV